MQQVELWMLLPFVVMLLTIAIAPLVAEHWWENNRNKLIFTLIVSVPTAILLVAKGLGHNVEHQLLFDYIPFIILLLALFVVTGGINIRGDIAATPAVNTFLLFGGWLLASFMGTTGAAMLMIRPLLQINQQRKHRVHTVLFFIALVANCGGLLTPLGDPPLFLLYLRGASFEWFFTLLPQWAFVGFVLLTIYVLWDKYYFAQEPAELRKRDVEEQEPIHVTGSINFIWLACVVGAVVFLNPSHIPAMADHDAPIYLRFLREIVLLVIIFVSLKTTSAEARKANHFSWEPIAEVAILFVGIFTTMTPALLYLNVHAPSMGLSEPWHFYYLTGALSSFLDNAPTAVAFHTVATGLPVVEGIPYVAGIPEVLLKAISLGAVFFGAMTYIGNGPNFMVKAIAESEGVKMPSFFGYMVKFSLVVLLPVYIMAQLLFF
ncbi:MAG: sodium:proton antiporter [Rikenellaceae bacterium]|nr:sodium:proton antiporter [Rikenellaceae bacterium]